MSSFLQDHPFAVSAYFESSLVLTYAVKKEELLKYIPECLEPDTLHDEYAFIAVAMVQTRSLRPKGFPGFLGNDFFLLGYRVFVKYHTNAGKRLRGLYILRSQTNKRKMQTMGNIFTHYNYSTIDVDWSIKNDQYKIHSDLGKLNIEVDLGNQSPSLPTGTPFTDWKEARRYAGPLPFTFTYNQPKKEVLIIEGVRENWKPRPVEVLKHEVGFIDELNLPGAILANAFIIENIPYYWKKGRKETWQPQENLSRV